MTGPGGSDAEESASSGPSGAVGLDPADAASQRPDGELDNAPSEIWADGTRSGVDHSGGGADRTGGGVDHTGGADDAGGVDDAVGEIELDRDGLLDEQRDWAWVEEWRRGGEPVPWGPGLTVAGFTLIVVASAVYVLSAGLSDRPIVAIAVNVLVAAGLGPALWLSRGLPVLRWIAGGAVAGLLAAWLCVLVFLV